MHNHDCTFLGLHEWHNNMFEKLGWMIMAKSHNNDLKINTYIDSIKNLQECLHAKINNTIDQDRKNDLKILLDNTECLNMCINIIKDLVIEKKYGNECKNGNAHNATFHGLHNWLTHKVEKLGWMCLANYHGNLLKPQCYIDSIMRLKASLEHKINQLHEQDNKDDLQILLIDVCALQHGSHKLFNISHHSSKKSGMTYKSRSTSLSKSKRTKRSTTL